jgi:hypothetical protein
MNSTTTCNFTNKQFGPNGGSLPSHPWHFESSTCSTVVASSSQSSVTFPNTLVTANQNDQLNSFAVLLFVFIAVFWLGITLAKPMIYGK